VFVTPLWVQNTAELGRRAMEHRFMLSKPLEPLRLAAAGKSPLTGGALQWGGQGLHIRSSASAPHGLARFTTACP
jgi:hypothetical protein